MTENKDLEELAEEVKEAFSFGVEEFRIKTFVDEGLRRAVEINEYFSGKGYRVRIFGLKDIDRKSDYPTSYDVIINKV